MSDKLYTSSNTEDNRTFYGNAFKAIIISLWNVMWGL